MVKERHSVSLMVKERHSVSLVVKERHSVSLVVKERHSVSLVVKEMCRVSLVVNEMLYNEKTSNFVCDPCIIIVVVIQPCTGHNIIIWFIYTAIACDPKTGTSINCCISM